MELPKSFVRMPIVLIVAGVVLSWLISTVQMDIESVTLEMDAFESEESIELFYDTGTGYKGSQVVSKRVPPSDGIVVIKFPLPDERLEGFRLDPTDHPGVVSIQTIALNRSFLGIPLTYFWSVIDIKNEFTPANDIDSFRVEKGRLLVNSTGADPYFLYLGDMNRFYSSRFLAIAVLMWFVFAALTLVFFSFREKGIGRPGHMKAERFFLLHGAAFGILFLFVTPPFMAPDEPDHFLRTYHISEGGLVAHNSEEGMTGAVLPESIDRTPIEAMQELPFERGKKLDFLSILALLDDEVDAEQRGFFSMHQMSLYSPVPYIPQTAGVLVGRAFHLSPLGVMYMGRLFNLALWLGLVYLAIKMTPVFKWMVLLIALIPISLFQSASLSADAATNGLGFLLIAAFFKFAFDTNRYLSKREIGFLFILIILISLCKQVYFVLFLLFLLIPYDNISSKKKYWFLFFLITGASVLTVAAWSSVVKDFQHINIDYYLKDSISPGEQVRFIILHPFDYLYTIFRTLRIEKLFIETYIDHLGWLDTKLPDVIIYPYIVVLFITACLDKNKNISIKPEQKFIAIICFFGIFFMIMTLFYMIWSPVGDNFIYGIQGRYFLAASVLLFFAFYNMDLNWKIHFNVDGQFILSSFIFTSLSVSLYCLLNQYYIRQDVTLGLARLFLIFAVLRSWVWILRSEPMQEALARRGAEGALTFMRGWLGLTQRREAPKGKVKW